MGILSICAISRVANIATCFSGDLRDSTLDTIRNLYIYQVQMIIRPLETYQPEVPHASKMNRYSHQLLQIEKFMSLII